MTTDPACNVAGATLPFLRQTERPRKQLDTVMLIYDPNTLKVEARTSEI